MDGARLRQRLEDLSQRPAEDADPSLQVNPGLLHLARFYFGDAAFLEGGRECLFEANGYIYLLDLEQKRVGALARGDRFILLTSRYEKRL